MSEINLEELSMEALTEMAATKTEMVERGGTQAVAAADSQQAEITIGRIIGLIEMMHYCMNDQAVSVGLECLRWARLAARALSSRVGAKQAEAAMERVWPRKGRRVCFVLLMLPMDDPTEVSAKFIIETILKETT